MKTNSKFDRKSGVEILRLFCIFGINICHLFSSGEELTGVNKYLCVFFNSSFNAGYGVVCFMLITGYFGVKLTLDKFNKLYSTIYICSLATLGYMLVFADLTKLGILKYLIPVTSKAMWYASCYIYLFFLSPFINKLVEAMSKKTYQALLGVLIALFYIAPTFLYFDIMQDKGKGLVHMLIAYLIGRYLKLYPIKISKGALWGCLAALIAICFAGNVFATIIANDISWPFSRDCTIITLLVSICALLIADSYAFVIKPINIFASKVFYMYLLGFVAHYLGTLINLNNYYNSPVYVPLILGLSAASMIICFIFAELLQYPALLMSKLMSIVEKQVVKIYNKLMPTFKGLAADTLGKYISQE